MNKLINPWTEQLNYNCLGCCPTNPIGAHMTFYEEGDDIVSVWCPTQNHQSWVDTLHGGMQATLLDEICGWVLFRKLDTMGVTAKMEMRYRRPVSTRQTHIVLRARIVEQRRNLVTIQGQIFAADGTLCAECTCLYFAAPHEKAAADPNFFSTQISGEEVAMEQAIEEAIAAAKQADKTGMYRPLHIS